MIISLQYDLIHSSVINTYILLQASKNQNQIFAFISGGLYALRTEEKTKEKSLRFQYRIRMLDVVNECIKKKAKIKRSLK